MNMKINQKGIDLIKKYEGFKSKPYLCPAGVPTIGYGSTYYLDGRKVKLTDPAISELKATELLMSLLPSYEKAVDSYTTDAVNSNQFSALVSFAYNLGNTALKGSGLLKKVNQNPNDPSISIEFAKWVFSRGIPLDGLRRRRKDESNLYFTK